VLNAEEGDFIKPYAEYVRYLFCSSSILECNLSYPNSIVEGNGLPLSSGEIWKSERKLLNPLFHFTALKSHISLMSSEAQIFAKDLKSRGDYLDSKIFSEITLKIIIQALFGGDFNFKAMMDQFEIVRNEFVGHALAKILLGKGEILVPSSIRLRSATNKMNNMIEELLQKRILDSKDDLLGIMKDIKDHQLIFDEGNIHYFV
jgi:cytochrome P450